MRPTLSFRRFLVSPQAVLIPNSNWAFDWASGVELVAIVALVDGVEEASN
jgi:hypothetical protein